MNRRGTFEAEVGVLGFERDGLAAGEGSRCGVGFRTRLLQQQVTSESESQRWCEVVCAGLGEGVCA
eukprot:2253408-Rhodomonas_salina.2